MQQDNSTLGKTLTGFFLILAIHLGGHPVWLLFTTHIASKPSIEEHKSLQTKDGRADILWMDNVNIYRNNNIYAVCDQGCEVINMRIGGIWYRKNGQRVYELRLATYFSEYALKTDSIVPGNRLVLYLDNGDSLAKASKRYYAARSMGNLKRYYAIHAARESSYYPINEQELAKISGPQNIVGIKIESQHDTLVKTLNPKVSRAIIRRCQSLSNSFDPK